MGFLFEKYGIKEFDNEIYFQTIDKLSNVIFNETNKIYKNSSFEGLEDVQFSLYNYNFRGILSWIDNLQIFVNKDDEFYQRAGGECISITNDCGDTNFYESQNGHINNATIFLYKYQDISKYNIKLILYHELGHIFYDLKSCNIFYKDLNHSLTYRDNRYFSIYLTKDNSRQISARTCYELIKIIMYYANSSEKHAYVETANFEISYSFKNKEIVDLDGYQASETMDIFKKFKNNLEILKSIPIETKNVFNDTYGDKIKEIYGKPMSYDKLIDMLYNRINHSYKQMCNLYNFYYQSYLKGEIEFINEDKSSIKYEKFLRYGKIHV